MAGPKILFVDIETSPILAYVWRLFDENVGLNQIKTDWFVLSWAAKWKGTKKLLYTDQRTSSDIENDTDILVQLWHLLDEADIVVTQNGRRFDHKKLNARFILNGLQPPSHYKTIDTYVIAKKYFGFTSNKLEYMSDKLCKTKKYAHRKYAGFDLWKACLAHDVDAWREMEKYNKKDVIALEELYNKLIPWDSSINFSLYANTKNHVCSCGSRESSCNGFAYTASGKYQRYKCVKCGKEWRGGPNLLSTEKVASLKRKVTG